MQIKFNSQCHKMNLGLNKTEADQEEDKVAKDLAKEVG